MVSNKQIRVAFFLSDFQIGGIEKVFIEYANSLVLKNYQVTFIVLKKQGILLDQVSKRIEIKELRKDKYWNVLFPLMNLLRKEKWDFIVTGAERGSIMMVLANFLLGNVSKIIVSQHNYAYCKSLHIMHKTIMPWIYKKAYKIFAVSQGIKNMIVNMGIKPKKITVLYNPMNIKMINEMANKQSPVVPNEYILYVGRFYAEKNLKFLINAFSIFLKKNPSYKLLLIGDGDERAELIEQVRYLNISDSVIFHKPTSNPFAYMKKAKLLVLTSFSESLSNVVLEAVCLGKTVVSTPCCGPEEILKSPTYGYVSSDCVDYNAFADLMSYSIEHLKNETILKDYSLQYNVSVSVQKLVQILE